MAVSTPAAKCPRIPRVVAGSSADTAVVAMNALQAAMMNPPPR
jgi:hypothetical protein